MSDPVSLYYRSRELRDAGRYSEAATILGMLVDIDSTEPLFHWELGYTLLEANLPHRSIQQFEKALALDPESFPAWGGLGHAYMAIEEWGLAEGAFRKRLELKEGPNHYVFLAFVLRSKGDYLHAIEICEQAIARNQINNELYFQLGVALRRLGRLEEAIQAFLGALNMKPDYALAHTELDHTRLLRREKE